MAEVSILGIEAELDDQFEITALELIDFEADEVTEIVEIDASQEAGDLAQPARVSFMSSLFRNL